jgi:hypothetical protein
VCNANLSKEPRGVNTFFEQSSSVSSSSTFPVGCSVHSSSRIKVSEGGASFFFGKIREKFEEEKSGVGVGGVGLWMVAVTRRWYSTSYSKFYKFAFAGADGEPFSGRGSTPFSPERADGEFVVQQEKNEGCTQCQPEGRVSRTME